MQDVAGIRDMVFTHFDIFHITIENNRQNRSNSSMIR